MINAHMKKGDRVTTFDNESYTNDENGIPRRDPQWTGTVIGWSYMTRDSRKGRPTYAQTISRNMEYTVVVNSYEDIVQPIVTTPRIQIKMDKPELWPFSFKCMKTGKTCNTVQCHPSLYSHKLKGEN